MELIPADPDRAASNHGLCPSLGISATPHPGALGRRQSGMGNLLESGQEGWTALLGVLKGFYPSEMVTTSTTVKSKLQYTYVL